jgi:hypothetical protein
MTLTCGQRARKALNARVYWRTVGSWHGRRGHAEPSFTWKEISGSTPAACALASQSSSHAASVGFCATFQDGK